MRGSLGITMAILLASNPATGGPGIEPRWTRSDKDGVGTAYSASSQVWFTVSKGILNEVYFPTIDRAADTRPAISHHRRRNVFSRRTPTNQHARVPGARRVGLSHHQRRSAGRFRLIKEVIADPHQACVLMHTRLEADADLAPQAAAFRPAGAASGSRRPGQQCQRRRGQAAAVS